MANPSVLLQDTILYCLAEPEGRTFCAGEQWPGDAWSSNRGGEPVGKGATKQALEDLVAAQDRLDAMAAQLSAVEADKARLSGERDAMALQVDGLTQRALEAEKGQELADARVHDMMVERDQARSDFQRVSDQLAGINRNKAEVQVDTTQNHAAADQSQAPELAASPTPKKTRGPNKPKRAA